MKLLHARIQNFKGIRDLALDFRDDPLSEVPRPITALLGDNGSGKTSVLQAIALTLGLATRRVSSIDSFSWPGFIAERMGTLGKTRIELCIAFDRDEILAVGEYFHDWDSSQPAEWRQGRGIQNPSDQGVITLEFDGTRQPSTRQGQNASYQFLGRYYTREMPLSLVDRYARLGRVGDVFWFDQFRSLATSQARAESTELDAGTGWIPGVEELREQLAGAWSVHTGTPANDQVDVLGMVMERFSKVFPEVSLSRPVHRGSSLDYSPRKLLFLLTRNGVEYDIGEMSSGEQAVFPLLWRFVQQRISRSIVLIDELEMHLHPPQQQALLANLTKIAPDCQFIITTHSPYLEGAIPDEHEIRLPGGHPCL